MTPEQTRQKALEAARKAYDAEASGYPVDEASLAAAIAAYERALWQSIETAPKGEHREGPRIFVETQRGWVGIAYWQKEPVKWEGEDTPCWAVFECEDHYYSIYLDDDPPVRWRPVPARPGDAP